MESKEKDLKFKKKAFVLEVILSSEFELFQLLAPNGAPALITDDKDELIEFLRS